MSYSRTTSIDTAPAGDTVKQGFADLDADMTNIFNNLNIHEALTSTHGIAGAIVGTTDTQALTNKTINGLTPTAAATGFTLAGGTTSKTLTVTGDTTLIGTPIENNAAGANLLLDNVGASTAYQVLRRNSDDSDYEFADDPYMPWMIDIDAFLTPGSSTNWDTAFTIDTAAAFNGTRTSTGDQNAEITWPVVLSAGTWTVSVMYTKWDAGGVYSVQIDGTEKGTIDSYAASPSYSAVSAITDIAVAAPGKYTLKLKMATKHASSSGYGGALQKVRLIRTA